MSSNSNRQGEVLTSIPRGEIAVLGALQLRHLVGTAGVEFVFLTIWLSSAACLESGSRGRFACVYFAGVDDFETAVCHL
jgi:hypothetical protein